MQVWCVWGKGGNECFSSHLVDGPVTVSTQSCDCQHAVLWLSEHSHVTVSTQSYDCQHALQSYDCQHAVLWLSAHSPVTVSSQSYDCRHAVLWLSARSPMTVSTQSCDCQHAVLWLSARSQHGFLSSLVIIVGCFFFFAFSVRKTVTLLAHAG